MHTSSKTPDTVLDHTRGFMPYKDIRLGVGRGAKLFIAYFITNPHMLALRPTPSWHRSGRAGAGHILEERARLVEGPSWAGESRSAPGSQQWRTTGAGLGWRTA